MRKTIVGVCLALLVVVQMGCNRAHKQASRAATDASEAEKDLNEQKAKILKDYRKCLSKNKSDEDACADYQKALDAL